MLVLESQMTIRQDKTAFPLPARKGTALASGNMVEGKRFSFALKENSKWRRNSICTSRNVYKVCCHH